MSPLETICMTCKSCFYGKIRKNISICPLLKILPRVLSIKDNVKDHHTTIIMNTEFMAHLCTRPAVKSKILPYKNRQEPGQHAHAV